MSLIHVPVNVIVQFETDIPEIFLHFIGGVF